MNPLKYFLRTLPIFLFVCSCIDTKNHKLIVGNWYATEWLINGKPSEANVKNTSFTFNDKGEYTFVNSGYTEKGTYKIEKDMLFTTPKGEQEMMVRIAKLTADSLVFNMNRGGQPETLTLLKR